MITELPARYLSLYRSTDGLRAGLRTVLATIYGPALRATVARDGLDSDAAYDLLLRGLALDTCEYCGAIYPLDLDAQKIHRRYCSDTCMYAAIRSRRRRLGLSIRTG